MNHQESFEDSFESDSIVSRVTPKRNEQPAQPSVRTRFTILSDMNEVSSISKKGEEQSLLSKYLKDLHEEQTEIPTKSAPHYNEQREFSTACESKQRKQKENDLNDANWKRKSGQHLMVDKFEDNYQLHHQSQNLRISKMEPESFGIFVYKKKIDLNQPIDFDIDETLYRSHEYSKRSSQQILKEVKRDELTFELALSKQKYSKLSKF